MTAQKHTPEPWHAPGIGEVCDESGRCIGIMIDCNPVEEELRPDPELEEGDANARRIVACVNACAGIDTAHLELALAGGVTVLQELDRVNQQRDQLRAALEDVMKWIENWDAEFTFDPDWPESRDKARAALAAMEGV